MHLSFILSSLEVLKKTRFEQQLWVLMCPHFLDYKIASVFLKHIYRPGSDYFVTSGIIFVLSGAGWATLGHNVRFVTSRFSAFRLESTNRIIVGLGVDYTCKLRPVIAQILSEMIVVIGLDTGLSSVRRQSITVSFCRFGAQPLSHCALVTPYGHIDLGQHWLR